MDVHVKLSLQGGQVWDFYCDEDDPIVFGLVSSLPGANIGGHSSPDGIIQIQTRTGRLYLTRSSLIAVEIIPVIEAGQAERSQRFVVPSAGFSGGMAAPAPFVSAPSILAESVHRALLQHAQGQHETKPEGAQSPARIDLGSFQKDVEGALRASFEKAGAAFNLPIDQAYDIKCEMFALGNAQALAAQPKAGDLLSFVYHFHSDPKGFTGGGIRLFDGQTDQGMTRASDSFRDLEIKDNSLLMFPPNVIAAGLPVRSPGKAFADGLFAIYATLRKGAAA